MGDLPAKVYRGRGAAVQANPWMDSLALAPAGSSFCG